MSQNTEKGTYITTRMLKPTKEREIIKIHKITIRTYNLQN
jgi:hypothetical protein